MSWNALSGAARCALCAASMALPLGAQRSLHGRVVALDGKPWRAATVRLIEANRMLTDLGGKSTTTDERGRFRFVLEDDRPYFVWAFARGRDGVVRRCSIVGPRRAGSAIKLYESFSRQVLHHVEWAEFEGDTCVQLSSTVKGDRLGSQSLLVEKRATARRAMLPPWPVDSMTATLTTNKGQALRTQWLDTSERHLRSLVAAAGRGTVRDRLQLEFAKKHEGKGRPLISRVVQRSFARIVDRGVPCAQMLARVHKAAICKAPQRTDDQGGLCSWCRAGRVTVVAELPRQRARELAGDASGPVARTAWLGTYDLKRSKPAVVAVDKLVPLRLRAFEFDGTPADHASVFVTNRVGLLVATTDRLGRITVLVAPGSAFHVCAAWPTGHVEREYRVANAGSARFHTLPLRSVAMKYLRGRVVLAGVGRYGHVQLSRKQHLAPSWIAGLRQRSVEIRGDGRFEVWVPESLVSGYRFDACLFDDLGRKVAEQVEYDLDGSNLDFHAREFSKVVR